MSVSNNALFVDQDSGGPSPDSITFPNFKVVVLHHRITNPQLRHRSSDFIQRLFPRKLWAMNPDDGEAFIFVLIIPVPQPRDDVLAVNSAVGPKLHENDTALQVAQTERLGIDPRATGDFRRFLPCGERLTAVRPQSPQGQCQYHGQQDKGSADHTLSDCPPGE
jgi:hypothetical protein